MSERPTAEGLRFTERLAWLGFMLFFVIVLAIYMGDCLFRGWGAAETRRPP